ncbi:MAG TPA: methyltransferase domain-containing protein [Pyrinomonadaceae bacterium]
MSDPRTQEIDVNRLMANIREAVARRQNDHGFSLLESSAALRKVLSDCEVDFSEKIDLKSLEQQAEFKPTDPNRYHLNELLQYHDRDFVRNAYRALLKREPDDTGYNHYLEGLRSGHLTKRDIIIILRASPEGRNKGVVIEGLRLPVVRRTLYRIPGVRYLVQLVMGIIRLPIMMRHQAEFQTYSAAENQRLEEQTKEMGARLAQQLSENFSEISRSQKQITTLQHQQIGALFREQQEQATQQRLIREEILAQPSAAEVHRMIDQAAVSLTPANGTSPAKLTPTEQERIDEFYAAFENQFRGGPSEIKESLRFYLPYLKDAGIENDVLDLGSGRGDWLELLREEGIEARGIDSNPMLVKACGDAGFDVLNVEALDHLQTLPDQSVNAVTGFHIVEHLSFENLILLVTQIARVLKPRGLLIFESPSPENLVVAACNFYADPTHRRPVYPHTLKFLLSNSGFSDVRLEFLHPVENSPYRDGEGVSKALHTWFYGPRDYAVIGVKV